MPLSEQIDELLLRWEAARQQGRALTLNDLCAECPELTNEVQERIRAVQTMERVLGVNGCAPPGTIFEDASSVPDSLEREHLPRIPNYEILRVVDQGGMGIVYEARQVELGRTVALKMIARDRIRPTVVARFKAEAEAAAHMQHPNFIQVFDVGQVNGRPFFSMEFVTGGSLARQLAQARPSAQRAAELIETLAQAMQAAHERGIVHRDLKPANVMLAADGTPKIADFGLAKRFEVDSNHTQSGEVLGTPSYMAPEQAEGKKAQIGPATDVYALGAILYEMLTGRPPFEETSPLELLRLVTTQEPLPPSRLVPSIPPDLEAICLKCLEKAPARRYGSARQLAEDLRRFLNGHPVLARRIGPVQRMWKWLHRHRQGVALASALAILGLLPVLSLLGQYRTQRQVQLQARQDAPLVREILKRHCAECHGGDSRNIKKNLDILNHKQLLDRDRHIVVPGEPGDSLLIQRIADNSMPPEEEETRLPRVTDRELAILKGWILGGAPPLPLEDRQQPTTSLPHSPLAARVKEIFQKQCYECHKYDTAKGGIKILNHPLLLTVRKVVIPHRPEESRLFNLLLTEDEEERMPPPPNGRLTPEEIAVIRQWIEEGALPFPKKK